MLACKSRRGIATASRYRWSSVFTLVTKDEVINAKALVVGDGIERRVHQTLFVEMQVVVSTGAPLDATSLVDFFFLNWWVWESSESVSSV